jgi:hypothetical protein
VTDVTVDTTLYTADALYPTADGYIPANLVQVFEPVTGSVTADTTLYSADNTTWPTADGYIPGGAQDFTDALVIPATAVGEPGGGYYPRLRPRPHPVEGYGYGRLPRLTGEAYGVVGEADDGLDEMLLMLLLLDEAA